MSDKYILDGKTPVKCDNLVDWAKWFETANRTVAKDKVGDVRISTVFLGLNHRFGDVGAPLIFETMIFDGPHEGHQTRASTWEEAEKQHADAVAMVRGGMN